MPRSALSAALCVAAFLAAPHAHAQGASFEGLGFLAADSLWSHAHDVSDDGLTVVGYSIRAVDPVFGEVSFEAFRWTEGGGLQGLGDFPGGDHNSLATGVSGDGAVVAGTGSRAAGAEAFRWAGSLAGIGVLHTQARGVSADGSVIVGTGIQGGVEEAFRWTLGGGIQWLGDLPGGQTTSHARGVSADGAVVVGLGAGGSGNEAFRWTAATGMVGLGHLPGGPLSNSFALAASADGAVVVGGSTSAAGPQAFRWTAATGMVGLGVLPGGLSSEAHGVSADGRVVVGHSVTPAGIQAFVWTEGEGMRSLRDLLIARGVDVTGWHIIRAFAVSADGRVVVGQGVNPAGKLEAFRAVLGGGGQWIEPALGALVVGGEGTRLRWTALPDSLGPLEILLLPDTLGAPRRGVTFGLAPSVTAYSWTVPDSLYSRSARLVLRVMADTTVADTSAYFRIKPYHLTRLSADGARYVPFHPARHGWQHANNAANWFPPAWYAQFNYRTGADPFTGFGYDSDFPNPPVNASPPVHADWPAFVRAFGTDAAYHLIAGPLSVYRASFTAAWGAHHGGQGFGGSCYGIATTSLLAFSYRAAFGARYPAVGAVDRLFTVPMSAPVRELVNEQYCQQRGRLARAAQSTRLLQGPRVVLAMLKAALTADSTSATLSAMSMKGVTSCSPFASSGGHAVTPYRLQRDPSAAGRWRIYIYDSNWPADSTRFVVVDSTANQWAYAGGLNWGGACGLFLRDPIANYLGLAIFDPLAPAEAGLRDGGGTLYVAAAPGADVRLASAAGAVGYAGGAAFNTLDGAFPDVPDVGGDTPPVGYEVPPGAYALTMSAFPGPAASAYFFGDGAAYAYGRADADPAHTDHLAYDPGAGLGGGLTAASRDAGATKLVTLRALLADGPALERTLDAAELALAGADSVDFAAAVDVDGPRLRLRNRGGAKTYTLRLREASASGAPLFVHHAVPLAAGAAHLVRPRWTTLADSTVAVDVDADGDGKPDTTLVLQNQALTGDLLVTLTPEASPVVIPSGGGAFRFTFAVTNTTAEPITFEAWTAVEGPVDRSPVVGPRAVTLPAGATASRALRQRVPGAAPAGTYSYSGFGGTFPSDVFASDAFAVTKEGAAARAHGGAPWPAAEWGDDAWTITGGGPMVATAHETPAAPALHAPYPNPFDGRTTVGYDVAEAGRVRLALYDLLGREVAVLVDGERAAGRYEAVLDGGALASGTYLVRMTTASGFARARPITLLR